MKDSLIQISVFKKLTQRVLRHISVFSMSVAGGFLFGFYMAEAFFRAFGTALGALAPFIIFSIWYYIEEKKRITNPKNKSVLESKLSIAEKGLEDLIQLKQQGPMLITTAIEGETYKEWLENEIKKQGKILARTRRAWVEVHMFTFFYFVRKIAQSKLKFMKTQEDLLDDEYLED
jgi:hypothetical protein